MQEQNSDRIPTVKNIPYKTLVKLLDCVLCSEIELSCKSATKFVYLKCIYQRHKLIIYLSPREIIHANPNILLSVFVDRLPFLLTSYLNSLTVLSTDLMLFLTEDWFKVEMRSCLGYLETVLLLGFFSGVRKKLFNIFDCEIGFDLLLSLNNYSKIENNSLFILLKSV